MKIKPLKREFTLTKNDGRKVTFGPYDTANEAREAFQRVYGYWPEGLAVWRYYRPSQSFARQG